MSELFPQLWLQRTCGLSRLLRHLRVPLRLQGQALVAAVKHCARTIVAELAASES